MSNPQRDYNLRYILDFVNTFWVGHLVYKKIGTQHTKDSTNERHFTDDIVDAFTWMISGNE